MAKEITKEQPSEEAKDSMGNPVGYSHKRSHVPDGRGKPFPSFKAVFHVVCQKETAQRSLKLRM